MFNKQIEGRKLITTYRKIVGDVKKDETTIKKILEEVLPIHNENVTAIQELFDIFFNNADYWKKVKTQRPDIDNKITVDDAWAITRTINGYCFGEPIKYVSRKTDDESGLQEKVELLSEMLDYQHNHDATIMATTCASVCGLGYKMALPSNKEEYEFSGVPFTINPEIIDPTKSFCVYSTDIMHDKVIGVLIGCDEEQRTQYTVWTKYHEFVFVEGDNGLERKSFEIDGTVYPAYPSTIKRIPLVEISRNAFRKGDWEVAKDLLILKSKLFSNRIDDIQQVVDYILVLVNCDFQSDDDKVNAIKSRVIALTQKNPQNPPSVNILKNPLDQNGIQTFADYIDAVIETVTGIPNRAERGGGGHDTGMAVLYRNGFRDLENNAGMIIPKMDKAETEFLGICIAYSHTFRNDKLRGLSSFDVRNKFVRSMSDDPLTASNAYSTFKGAGMNDLDALIASRAVTDPSEVHKNNVNEENRKNSLTSELNRDNNENDKSKTDEGNNEQNSDEG